jgi:formylmethanofuran dehydrogenase subunit E
MATDAERARFQQLHQAQSRVVLDLDPDDLFSIEEISGPPPRKARIHATVVCARCGEGAMETRIRRLDGQELCPPCFDAAVAGEEPVAIRSTARR